MEPVREFESYYLFQPDQEKLPVGQNISQKRFVIITEDANGRIVSQITHDDPVTVDEMAARSVNDKAQGGYMVAHVYERVKSCRTPMPEVEWATEPKHKRLGAPKV